MPSNNEPRSGAQAEPQGDAILHVEGATKLFGGVAAVQDISFDLFRGEILGLIGPNGAGKTTLVNLISGMTAPSRGVISYGGRTLNALPPHMIGWLGIARTFQVMRPFRNLSVRENVAVGAMYGHGGGKRNLKEAFSRADEVLRLVGLEVQADAPSESLPVAGRKRLEMARALAMDPDLLLLDEAMAGLRGREIDEAMDLVRSVNATGVTIIVIEHVMKVIQGVCARVVVLDYGRKIAEGTPAEVMMHPEVIRAYLGQRYARAHAPGGEGTHLPQEGVN